MRHYHLKIISEKFWTPMERLVDVTGFKINPILENKYEIFDTRHLATFCNFEDFASFGRTAHHSYFSNLEFMMEDITKLIIVKDNMKLINLHLYKPEKEILFRLGQGI